MVASLVRGNVSVHDTGQGHVTPLHAAARLGFAAIAAVLISNGARYVTST
jgi:ankyrin repeat protein